MNLEPGLVSVIMPAYNSEAFIEQAVRSVQAQTYTAWELIIVDDCSTDGTAELAHELSREDSRIRCLRLSCNSGAAVARNCAMNDARGQYMAFLDSDDLWHPDKLEKQLQFMTAESLSFTCTAYQQVTGPGMRKGRVIRSPKRISYRRLLLDCPVGNSTVMYDVSRMGKFEVPDIRKRNDDALWLRMLRTEPFIWSIPDVLAYYRVRSGSVSSNKLSLVKYHWTLYRRIERLGVVTSVYHLIAWGVIKVFRLK
ncbi:teichuronic acid biosynthesis glycosyltransferase TuaG [Actinomyces ruminicola]|uniref:Teichuronic acid biosynthesis glycosyltransferase TuaG n=1 Tax=Actinomyces ruminicola TaxID=332524 RepID=A0A1G9ZEZ7_9ACTO|nr:glycosyltransferase family 2 protein [Actinomyces ruminicola]SDN19717.1 teichuronic acid biosynthesis glycosyltransferase TuaG [Actinomyces ruminicola]